MLERTPKAPSARVAITGKLALKLTGAPAVTTGTAGPVGVSWLGCSAGVFGVPGVPGAGAGAGAGIGAPVGPGLTYIYRNHPCQYWQELPTGKGHIACSGDMWETYVSQSAWAIREGDGGGLDNNVGLVVADKRRGLRTEGRVLGHNLVDADGRRVVHHGGPAAPAGRGGAERGLDTDGRGDADGS